MRLLLLLLGYLTSTSDLYIQQSTAIANQLPYSRKVWQINLFRAFGERKFGEL